jgi:hypothetical protein
MEKWQDSEGSFYYPKNYPRSMILEDQIKEFAKKNNIPDGSTIYGYWEGDTYFITGYIKSGSCEQ